MRIIIAALLITMLFSLLFATYDKDIDHLISDAENGDMEAQYILGLSYYRGEGVEAVYWLEQAANQGHADAQYYLGVSYANGEGVEKNSKQAVYWYEKAANQGHADAQNNLGVCYEFGKGVVQNYQTAYFWYLLASANGIEKAKDNMDRIAQDLSPSQQIEIQNRATRWFGHNNGR